MYVMLLISLLLSNDLFHQSLTDLCFLLSISYLLLQLESEVAKGQAEKEELEKRRTDQQQILGRSNKLSFGLKKKATLF